ncbi:MAG: SDR family NAD(P)-dependent oxidoreductase [Alphaproteobacteria bacterium]|nr:SDR family NAD(P)-dependent oxidoreductase [Alphaproteobacteria bacterium]MDE2072775.1 SDR family NAD(P)-dependent oxidoreductase [Alphaproteobacteria bacterium]
MSGSLADRIVLVTGASRGIGRVCALALAKAGAHVIAVARTQGALEELDDEIRTVGGTATLVPLDLKDMPALDRLGGSIFERWGRLDGFLGNAGMLGVLTPLSHLEPKAFEQTMAVNVAANWRLIRSLDPLLRQSGAGRVVFVTSGAAQKHTPFWGIYAASKAALESLALTYAAECATTNVKVNLFNPGPLRTAMRAKAFPGEDPMTLQPPEAVVPAILDLLSPACTANGERVNFRNL